MAANATTCESKTQTVLEKEGKYLTFALGSEE